MGNLLENAKGLSKSLSNASFAIGASIGNPDVPNGSYTGTLVSVDYSDLVVKNEESSRKGQSFVKVNLTVETDEHEIFNVSDGRFTTGLSLAETEKQVKQLATDYIEGRKLRFAVAKQGQFTNARLLRFAEK